MPVRLTYNSLYCHIEGQYPYDKLYKILSYSVPGAYFAQRRLKFKWDGRQSLILKIKGEVYFPTGLIYHVKELLEKEGIKDIEYVDNIGEPPLEKNPIELDGVALREYQLDAINQMVTMSRGILDQATGVGKTELMIAYAQHAGLPTLFAVYGNDLVVQSYERFKARLGKWLDSKNRTLGLLTGTQYIPGDILIAGITKLATLLKRTPGEFNKLVAPYKVLLLDEIHMDGAATFYKTCMHIPAPYRFGFSGTPLYRTDNANKRVIAITGPVIDKIPNKEMVQKGYLAKASIEFIACSEPKLSLIDSWKIAGQSYARLYEKFIVSNEHRNNKICEKVKFWTGKDKGIVVLIRQIRHGQIIQEMLSKDPYNIQTEFVYGNDLLEKRVRLTKAFRSGELKVLVASTIFDQGIDLPNIDVLVLGGGGKSPIKTLQRLGRGLRGNFLHVVEFADKMHFMFRDQALERLKQYQREDAFDIFLTEEVCSTHASQPT